MIVQRKHMQTIGIRELQTNPAIFTKALENNEFTMITKRSTPIGVAIAFDDTILSKGLKTSLLIEAYKNGSLSMGQLSRTLGASTEDTMQMLSMMGINVIDYDFKEDLSSMDAF